MENSIRGLSKANCSKTEFVGLDGLKIEALGKNHLTDRFRLEKMVSDCCEEWRRNEVTDAYGRTFQTYDANEKSRILLRKIRETCEEVFGTNTHPEEIKTTIWVEAGNIENKPDKLWKNSDGNNIWLFAKDNIVKVILRYQEFGILKGYIVLKPATKKKAG